MDAEQESDQQQGSSLLAELGNTVRTLRGQRGLTRKDLSHASQVSERYLAQLEQGQGNISVNLLERVATALDTRVGDLLSRPGGQSAEEVLIMEIMSALDRDKQRAALQMIQENFAVPTGPRQRIGLIGLRGSGKSTLGTLLSEKLEIPFVRLSAEVEALAGMSVSEIFSLSGQSGYRRLEEQAMMDTLKNYNRCVIEIGGSIGTDPRPLNTLLASCFVIWLKAEPEIYMERVIRQGDLRPMKNNDDALADLRRILVEREEQYARAHAMVDTSHLDVNESLAAIRSAIPEEIINYADEENESPQQAGD